MLSMASVSRRRAWRFSRTAFSVFLSQAFFLILLMVLPSCFFPKHLSVAFLLGINCILEQFVLGQVKDTAVLTARFADLRMLTSIMSGYCASGNLCVTIS